MESSIIIAHGSNVVTVSLSEMVHKPVKFRRNHESALFYEAIVITRRMKIVP